MKKVKLARLLAVSMVVAMSTTTFIACKSKETTVNSNSQSIEDSVTKVETKLTNAKLDGEKVDKEGTVITTMVHFTPLPAGHGNPAVNGGPEWSMEPIMYDYLTDYSAQPEKTFKPSLLEEYTFSDKLLTLKLKKDLKWSDGSSITSDDLISNIFMDMTVNKVAYFAETITRVDDLTVEIKYNKDSDLILDYILKMALKYPQSEYGKWSSQFKLAFENNREINDQGDYKFTKAGDEIVLTATTEFNNYLPDLMTVKCSGPYMPEKATSAEMIFKQNPYFRIETNIEKIRGIRPTSTESTAVSIMNNEYTAEAMGLSPDMALKVAENNKETIRQLVVPEFSSLGFAYNVRKYPTDNVKIRKAISYIIDKAQIAPVSEPGMRLGDEYAVALPPSVRDKYLSKEFLSTLDNYTMDLEKAAELLEESGWSKKGDKWVDENGESPEIKVAGVGEYAAYVVIGEAATNMLNEFGLNAVFTPKEAAAYNDYANSGDAHMVIDGFGSSQNTQHPYEAYDAISWYGKRMNLEFPKTGAYRFMNDETGEMFEYSDNQIELFNAKTPEEISAATEKMAQFYNDNMWFIPVTEKFYVFRIHDSKLSMPEAPTGEELKNFYWSGTQAAILGKSLKSGETYYIK